MIEVPLASKVIQGCTIGGITRVRVAFGDTTVASFITERNLSKMAYSIAKDTLTRSVRREKVSLVCSLCVSR